MVIILGRTLLN